jgi:Tfp pilus assembly protein PilN
MKAVNLLPPDSRGAAKAPAEHATVVTTDQGSGFGAFALIGGLVVAVLAVAGVVLAGNAIKDREAQLASVQAQSEQIQTRAAKLKPFAEFDQLASERVETVKDLAGHRFDWEQALRDLSRALPADTTLSSIDGNVSTDAGGSGGGSLRGAISAPAITLRGCTPSQHSTARLMARLRNVDGVTRVSLAKSEKTESDSTSAAGAGSAVPGASSSDASLEQRLAAPCGEGSRPQFEIVIFFEGQADVGDAPSATPAAAGTAGAPGQPAASASATPTASATPAAGGASSTTTSTSTSAPQATPTTQGGVAP